MKNSMEEIQRLIDSTFPLVTDLIEKYGEFFPLASGIKEDGSIAQIGTFDGNEHPLPEKLISDLKNAIRAYKENYKVIAIFYDVIVINPKTNIKTDSIAVFVEANNLDKSYTLFYPYQKTDFQHLIFSDGWRDENDKEIFLN